MDYLLLFLASVTLIEALRAFHVVQLLLRYQRSWKSSIALFRRAGVSDHWKERAMLIYAKQSFVRGLGLFLVLALATVPAAVIFYLAELFSHNLLERLMSWPGLLFCTATGSVHAWLRIK